MGDSAGGSFADGISLELVDWLRDTILLLSKNQGTVDGYEFREYGVEETFMPNEKCDKRHSPTYSEFEKKKNELTLQLSKSENEYDACISKAEVTTEKLAD